VRSRTVVFQWQWAHDGPSLVGQRQITENACQAQAQARRQFRSRSAECSAARAAAAFLGSRTGTVRERRAGRKQAMAPSWLQHGFSYGCGKIASYLSVTVAEKLQNTIAQCCSKAETSVWSHLDPNKESTVTFNFSPYIF